MQTDIVHEGYSQSFQFYQFFLGSWVGSLHNEQEHSHTLYWTLVQQDRTFTLWFTQGSLTQQQFLRDMGKHLVRLGYSSSRRQFFESLKMRISEKHSVVFRSANGGNAATSKFTKCFVKSSSAHARRFRLLSVSCCILEMRQSER